MIQPQPQPHPSRHLSAVPPCPPAPPQTPDADEGAALVERLVDQVTARFQLRCERDDLVAFGHQGLLEARRRFDPSRGARFSTYAYYRVRGAILDGVRRQAYVPPRVHRRMLEEGAGETAGQSADLAGCAKLSAQGVIEAVGQDDEHRAEQTPEALCLAAEDLRRVREALDVLPERERHLVESVYFQGRRLDHAGLDIGVSKSWASRLHARALRRMREQLLEECA